MSEAFELQSRDLCEQFPELALIYHFFALAVMEYKAYRRALLAGYAMSGSTRHYGKSAERWIFSDHAGAFGFVSVCNIVGLDPARVRNQLQAPQ